MESWSSPSFILPCVTLIFSCENEEEEEGRRGQNAKKVTII
jgi:hypothetical protein